MEKKGAMSAAPAESESSNLDLSEESVLRLFPYQSYRPYQKDTIKAIVRGFNAGKRVILLDSPTGSGKSGINMTVARAFQSTFYTTPQVTLVEQILHDPYLSKYVAHIIGRQHYPCMVDRAEGRDTTTDVGKCTRSNFKCPRTSFEPYWIAKMKAIGSQTILTTFAYLVLEGLAEGTTPPLLGNRDLLIIDEGHSVDNSLAGLVNFEISPFTDRQIYFSVKKVIDALKGEENILIIKQLVDVVQGMAARELVSFSDKLSSTLEGDVIETITIEEVKRRNRLMDLSMKCGVFSGNPDNWVFTLGKVNFDGKEMKTLKLYPVYAKYFFADMVWHKAQYFIVSSATLISPSNFIRETGLDQYVGANKVLHIQVPSTFPVENRPIIDATVFDNQKMEFTYKKTEHAVPLAVKQLRRVVEHEKILHSGEVPNIAVHAHSYKLARLFSEELMNDPYLRTLTVTHEARDRSEKLEKWLKHEGEGRIFISVGFEEGQNWAYDACRAQVLLDTPYMDLSDNAVAKRLRRGEWNWYMTEALKKVVQQYGRAVRASDDTANFYLFDGSVFRLLSRSKRDMPAWFKEALDKMVKFA